MVCIRAGAGFVSVPFSKDSPGLSRSEAALLLPPAYLIQTETGLEPSDGLAHKTVSGDAGVAVEEETDGVQVRKSLTVVSQPGWNVCSSLCRPLTAFFL